MRTIEAVRAEYVDTCARLGEHKFNRDVAIPKQILELECRIEALRDEADEIAQAQAEAAKAPVEVVPPAAP